MESNMKHYIEYYITPYKHILREFSDDEAFTNAKNAIYLQKGSSIAFTDSEGNSVIIPLTSVIMIREYSEGGEENA